MAKAIECDFCGRRLGLLSERLLFFEAARVESINNIRQGVFEEHVICDDCWKLMVNCYRGLTGED